MTPKEKAYVEEDLEGDAEDRADAQLALANGEVIDETYEIREAKQFVLHDGSGLVYFLRTSDDAVFYWEDEESEDLWCDDKSIFKSKAKPLSTLIVTSTVEGDIEFDIRFEGRPVPTAENIPMVRNGDTDLYIDDFVEDLAWHEVEPKYYKEPTLWSRLLRLLFSSNQR